MAIGTTAAVDPTTGERTESQFDYTPVDPNDELMRKAYEAQIAALNPPPPQPRGPTPYWENPATYYPQQAPQINPIEQAKAATAAAYKYIALRGYQQDLKSGASAADAFAKWGPMLVQDTSFAPALKALQPQPAYQYDDKTRTWLQKDASGRIVGKPVMDNRTQAPRWIPANPTTGEPAHYDFGNKVQFAPAAKPVEMNEGDTISMTLAKKRLYDAQEMIAKGTATPDELVNARQQGLMAKAEINAINKRYGFPNSSYNPFTAPTSQNDQFAAQLQSQQTAPNAVQWNNGTMQTVATSPVGSTQPSAPQSAAPKMKEDFPFAPLDKSKRINGNIYRVPVTPKTPNGIAVWVGNGFIAQ